MIYEFLVSSVDCKSLDAHMLLRMYRPQQSGKKQPKRWRKCLSHSFLARVYFSAVLLLNWKFWCACSFSSAITFAIWWSYSELMILHRSSKLTVICCRLMLRKKQFEYNSKRSRYLWKCECRLSTEARCTDSRKSEFLSRYTSEHASRMSFRKLTEICCSLQILRKKPFEKNCRYLWRSETQIVNEARCTDSRKSEFLSHYTSRMILIRSQADRDML